MNNNGFTKLRIFTASPSDVESERERVDVVVNLLKPLADSVGLTVEVYDWQSVVPDMGRPQQIILDQLKPTSWDIFIGILWHRFGTPSGGVNPKTSKKYFSGTEEEFLVAYHLWKQYNRPRIMIYRCIRPVPYDADPVQLKRVQKFFGQFESPKGKVFGLTQSFETIESFEKLLFGNLQKLLIAFGEEVKGKPLSPGVINLYVPEVLNNLPRRQTFFGREKELENVLNALKPDERGWGVVIDGIGGVGKTALAIEAAYLCKEQSIFNSYVFVSAQKTRLVLDGMKDINPTATTFDMITSVTAQVLGQIGITQMESEERKTALLNYLHTKKSLLVYDNLETLDVVEQEILIDWLRYLPQGCKAILTSRERGGDGAIWLRLENLDWKTAQAIIQHELERNEILKNKFRQESKERWHELYEETGGSPLALLHILGLMRVRVTLDLDSALDLIKSNTGDDDLLRFVFQEACKDLEENEIRMLYMLSFFESPATFDALQTMISISPQALKTIVERLNALSLINILENGHRFSLHPLTRLYIRDRLLADQKFLHTLGLSFTTYWVNFAKQYIGQNNKSFSQLESEWTNIRLAYQWAKEASTNESGAIHNKDVAMLVIRLVEALHQFLSDSGRQNDGLEMDTFAFDTANALNISFLRIFTMESSDERTDVQIIPKIEDGFISQTIQNKISKDNKNESG